ncbi:MAG TPA: radical SAM family heme chaperone HemW [Candidatus Binatia bacterium]|nr:radical SAM family heme chaperone HemW [Candidatus Binatia bacterium]
MGLYISVPFCRTKCTYCNFASDVFSKSRFDRYIERVCEDMANAAQTAEDLGAQCERLADSIYLGGGTPSLLDPVQLRRLFEAARIHFDVEPQAEITVECAPGTISDATLETLIECGVNRVSLGVQSFVDQEAAAVGRLHTRATVLADVQRLRHAGIGNINIDLIAGLPHQTAESWEFSLGEAIATGAPHVSVYMLEVDEDSRLGRELIAGGTRYHAHFVPDEESTADFYEAACEQLNSAGIAQYEISNFARPDFASRHNLKYWTRQPYLGFGVDAHSMLPALIAGEPDSIRFAGSDSLEQFIQGSRLQHTVVTQHSALEEAFFLGLRLNRGVDLQELIQRFGGQAIEPHHATIAGLVSNGLLECSEDRIRLTPRGRLLSNEVFERFILAEEIVR